MSYTKCNGDQKKAGAGRVVAVAIENNKTSQFAAKWAVDNLLPRDQCLLLIHVKQRAHSTSGHDLEDVAKAQDDESKELFDSFRVFCNRKSVQFQEVLLEEMDISKALIESVTTYSIELLVLGAASRGGLVKRFRTTDVPSCVSKGAPAFCTVYIISKGKISTVRHATAPLTSKATAHRERSNNNNHNNNYNNNHNHNHNHHHHSHSPQAVPAPHTPTERSVETPLSARNYPPRPQHQEFKLTFGSSHVQDDDHDIISGRSYGGSSIPDSDISFVSSSRPSVDRLFPSLCDDNMDSRMTPRLSNGSDFDSRSSFGSSYSAKSMEMGDYSFNSLSSRLSIPENTDEMETEMRRLKLELKQTMEMYSTACKEALTAKQKALELQRWKLEEQKKLEEARVAEEAALSLAEREKEKCMVAMKAAEASQRIAEFEAHKRMNAEMKNQAEGQRRKGPDSLGHGPARYRRYNIEEIEEATQNFSDSLKIGEGGYGPVYKCELDHTQVAVKVLRADAAQGRAQFQQEVEVLSCIRHPNMVLLLGACPEYGCLVYEYMANGSLDDCLFRRGKSPALPWQLRFQIAAEIATGLLFLHQTKPEPLVHRDLKPGNILLDRNYVSKISDVGLARLVPPSVADMVTQYRLTSTAGTFCYIDPEYQQTGMLGIKSDIYSLGVMLLQMVTARPPMGLTHHVGKSIDKGTFADMLDPAVKDWPMEQTLQFAKLALQCAEMRRKDRPDLGKVVLPELNKLRAFAEENMPMMMMFGGCAGYSAGSVHPSMHSSPPKKQDNRDESDSISGYEGRSNTSSLGRA